MSGLTTHVLDTARGRPAAGVRVVLEIGPAGHWRELGQHMTDADGRCAQLLPAGQALERGTYRLTFATGAYFEAQGLAAFHPEVTVVFEIREPSQHHHVPLLLSPFGYTTYRGS
jgi:5-hydroxyisourate hydrolase